MKLAQVVFDLVFERRNLDDVAVSEPLCVETFTTKAVKLEPTLEPAVEPTIEPLSGQIFCCVCEPFKEEQWQRQKN